MSFAVKFDIIDVVAKERMSGKNNKVKHKIFTDNTLQSWGDEFIIKKLQINFNKRNNKKKITLSRPNRSTKKHSEGVYEKN